ncbi:hypothetical protein BJV77DRAFT_987543 [Russula vinacea]|nr:hypothetical protein BJV77DRAFT_987543 [Russula vinacea]
METPNFMVVPPTPLDAKPAPSPSPSISTAPSTPGLTQSSESNQRGSSETTMEIYSMYGDDDRSSWPNDGPLQDMTRATESPYRNGGRSSHESSTYYSAIAKSQRSSYTDISSDLHSILPPPPPPKPQKYSRSGPSHPNANGAIEPAPQTRYLSPSPPRSRPSSARSNASSGLNGHTTSIPRSSHGPPSDHASLNSPSSRLISRPASQTTGTSTSPRLLTRKRSDLSSITPSAGEDPDSFHVRSTYAQLDVLGVKGDGIDEGVERTRARVGGSRESELQAMNAVGDEDEKRRDLSPQEVQMLASLDRYGFFASPSHDRFVLLPTASLLKPLSHISRAVTTANANAAILPSLPPPRPPIREAERMEKWGRMLQPRSRDAGGNVQTWRINPEKEHKLARRAFKGIPDRWRGAAWMALIGRFADVDKEQLVALSIEYREALEKHSQYDIQIDLDVPRTINGHILFRTRYGLGQRSLFHVLHSFSLHCDQCGYCQGMGPVAAMLLCYFAPERAYASLVHLHDAYHMHDIFSPGFPGLLESIYVQERITEEMMPEVYASFKKHITHLRLWDAFLLEGPDLFVIVAVSIIWDENVFMNWISKVAENKKMRSKMQSWRAEWKVLVASGRDGDALL